MAAVDDDLNNGYEDARDLNSPSRRMSTMNMQRLRTATFYDTENTWSTVLRALYAITESVGLNYVAAVIAVIIPFHARLGGDLAWVMGWAALIALVAVRGFMAYTSALDAGIWEWCKDDTSQDTSNGVKRIIIIKSVMRNVFYASATAWLALGASLGFGAAEYLTGKSAPEEASIITLSVMAVIVAAVINLVDAALATRYHNIKASIMMSKKDNGSMTERLLKCNDRWAPHTRLQNYAVILLSGVHLAVVVVLLIVDAASGADAVRHPMFTLFSETFWVIGAVCLATFGVTVVSEARSRRRHTM